jgi:hypothetical protein
MKFPLKQPGLSANMRRKLVHPQANGPFNPAQGMIDVNMWKILQRGVSPEQPYPVSWTEAGFEGEGAATLADGSTYSGTFLNGRFHGKGIYTWPDGSRYEGTWADGIPEGPGRLTRFDGSVLEGAWTAGTLVFGGPTTPGEEEAAIEPVETEAVRQAGIQEIPAEAIPEETPAMPPPTAEAPIPVKPEAAPEPAEVPAEPEMPAAEAVEDIPERPEEKESVLSEESLSKRTVLAEPGLESVAVEAADVFELPKEQETPEE